MAIYYKIDDSGNLHYSNENLSGYTEVSLPASEYNTNPAYDKYIIIDSNPFILPSRSDNLFVACTNTTLDTSTGDTSNVTNMHGMFQLSKLTELDLSSFETSNVVSMNNMFCQCNDLTTVNTSSFDTSKVTDMRGMFAVCKSLTSLDLSNFDTSNVTTMEDMFSGCSRLSVIDLSSFDTSKVTNMFTMFDYCEVLKTIYASDYGNTALVTESGRMFSHCYNLVGGSGTKCTSSTGITPIDKRGAAVDLNINGTWGVNKGYFTYKKYPGKKYSVGYFTTLDHWHEYEMFVKESGNGHTYEVYM